jgi:IclR family acetate operon transcriptional repressor
MTTANDDEADGTAGTGTRRRGQAQIQSLAKGLEMLALFRPGRPSLTVEELAREVNIPKSSAYRVVATLRDRGYLRKLPRGQGYALGAVMIRFGEVVRESSEIHQAAPPIMSALAAASRETAIVAVRSGDRGIVTDKADSPEMMRWIPEPGWSFPLHIGATGKIILAWMTPAERRAYLAQPLEQATERTLTDPAALEEELAHVREAGWAVADEEAMLGGRTVAAPVFDAHGTVVASLGIAGPSLRLTLERAEELAPMVMDHARRLSEALGATGHLTASSRH